MRKLRAFTLIEILVVVAVIALLISITMPSLAAARRVSKKTVCQKNLGQIGVALHAYLLANKDTFPYMTATPSLEPQLAQDDDDRDEYPPMYEVFKKAIKPDRQINVIYNDEPRTLRTNGIYLCPADTNLYDDAIPTQRFFDHEGTSYEWESTYNGLPINFKSGVKIYEMEELTIRPEEIKIVYDFAPFHAPKLMEKDDAGEFIIDVPNIINYLHGDLHVAGNKPSDDNP